MDNKRTLIHMKRATIYFSYNDGSATKVKKLREILNIKYGVFRNVQNIHSRESIMMQLADFLMGAVSYQLNNDEKKVVAKMNIIEKIQQHSNQNICASTNYNEKKLNLFFIELK